MRPGATGLPDRARREAAPVIKPRSIPQQVREFAQVLEPEDSDPPILGGPIRAALHTWMIEMNSEDELEAVGLTARRTAMLSGPPGCGKTTLAHHVAARLGLQMVVVNMATLNSPYISQTGNQIAQLFRTFEEIDCLLFLDEFDSIASKRTDDTQSAAKEKNNIVIALLQMLDSYKGMLVAATNRGDGIDPAIWRRFALNMVIDLPDDQCRFAIMKRYLEPMKLPDDDLGLLTDWTDGATPALLRQLMEAVKRELVLAPKLKQPTDAVSVFGRIMATVQPHTDLTRPFLWEGISPKQIEKLSWPPTR
jgi:hypothetical protein